MLKALFLLPGTVLVIFPSIIIYWAGYDLIKPSFSIVFFIVLLIFALSLFLMFWTMKLFAQVKHGSPAPWDPINTLIISGPYAYVRNPMLTGVFLFIFGESILLQSYALFGYMVVFIFINTIYFPLIEEKGLLKRYGEEYIIYKENVPRFIPRLNPWKK